MDDNSESKTTDRYNDYKNEDDDDYVKKLEADSKKVRYLRIFIITTYIAILILALIIL